MPHLLDARRAGAALPHFPGSVPGTLADAYACQHRLTAALGQPVLGWKVGRIPVPLIDQLGTDRLAGPVLRSAQLTGETPGQAHIFVGGAAAIEVELMLRLAKLPPELPATPDDTRGCVDRICAGFEVASSPAPDVHDHAPYGIIADVGINNGLLIGPELEPEGCEQLMVETRIADAVVGTGRACDILDGPWGALHFLMALHFRGEIRLAAGQWISAGAITGVHPIDPGQSATARFGDKAIIHCIAVPESEDIA
ncbi:2-keto-4-pentenoate hydratase [Sphingopyxis sp. MWB1]|uniref:2-keto-4-pentenoate hydratase n=1 Tax=Sphingopyxis sp. MWB1 TaxID=1537715 RepID=UPI001184BE3C|nr:2-keto-4-pentenoate hydratase [Sphingopyxis sp. MWB1]